MSTKVSHSVTVTETTTSTMPSSMSCYMGVLKTPSGLLKLLQTVVGIIIFGILLTGDLYHAVYLLGHLGIFYATVVSFLITTFLLLVSYLVSSLSYTLLHKSVFEVLYHFAGFLMFLSTSIAWSVALSGFIKEAEIDDIEESYIIYIFSAVLGFLNAILYLLSSYYAYKSFKSA